MPALNSKPTTKLLHTLLALLMWMSCNVLIAVPPALSSTHSGGCGAHALPITSRPIENTAENLAWQAWLLLPPEQKQLEKSRKVTPKSIFTLPFRQCPEGHQLYNSRCIPTVQIDQTQLLTDQLLGIFGSTATNPQNAFEYDYEDEAEEPGVERDGMLMFDQPQKLNGPEPTVIRGGEYEELGAPHAPSQDEPLKFNLFQQKFSTDYEAGELGSGGDELTALPNRTQTPFDVTQFLGAIDGVLRINATVVNGTNRISDLQSQSSHHILSNLIATPAISAPEGTATTSTSTTQRNRFSISDIDAIALPATHGHADIHADSNDHADADVVGPPHAHKISLFKDDSAVELVTALLDQRRHYADEPHRPPSPANMSQLLKVDALLPIRVNLTDAATTDTTTAVTATTTRTTAAQMQDGVTGSDVDMADDSELTTMLPNMFRDLLTAAGAEAEGRPPVAKDEHIRSAPQSDADDDGEANGGMTGSALSAQEVDFTTTTEPAATTNFQLDETTVIEGVNVDVGEAVAVGVGVGGQVALPPQPQEFEAMRLSGDEHQQQQRQQQQQQQHVVLKKSKVEPVELLQDQQQQQQLAVTPTTATTTMNVELLPAATKTLPATPLPSVKATTTMVKTPTTPSTTTTTPSSKPSATTATTIDDANRFLYQSKLASSIVDSGNVFNNNNNGMLVQALKKKSEINIEEELRMINALVKGNRQLPVRQPTATTIATATTTKATDMTTTILPSSTAATSRSSITTTTITTKTTPASDTAAVDDERTAATTPTAARSALNKATAEDQVEDVVVVADDHELNGDAAAAAAAVPVAALTPTPTPTTTTTSTTTTTTGRATTKMESNSNDQATTIAEQFTTIITTTPPSSSTTIASGNAATTTTTATIWSKIMPIFGFGTTPPIVNPAASSTTITTTTTTTSPTRTTATQTADRESASVSISSSNRSYRNSKIRKLADIPSITTTPSSPIPTTTIITTTTEGDTTISSSSYEPFWWLPTGWRLDRATNPHSTTVGDDDHQQLAQHHATDDADAHDIEQSLLLRFWSAFPANPVKVKL